MKTIWNFFYRTLIAIAVIAIALAIILPSFATSGRLHGNEYALHKNRLQMHLWKSETANSPSFDFWKLSFEDKRRAVILGLHLEVSFKTNFVWQSDKIKREVVIVCGKEFDNVPKSAWTFFLKNPAHSIGYSDGTTDLISPEAFTNLDLNGFISLSSLATNSELNIFKN